MIRKLLTVILTLAFCKTIFAIEPVTVVVSITPPYSPYLNEYALPGSNNLQVTLIVNDSRMQNYPACLQLFLERVGSGVVMRTTEVIAIPPIMLQGNTTEVLQGNDLTYYFMPQNLIFQGVDRNQYIQTNRIPDGQYRIGFRVVDSRRSDVILSNTAYTSPAWFILNDPPMLNLPRSEAKERVNSSQLVKFEWFPRHFGSMNASFAAKYQLELFAIRVQGMDYKQVAMSAQPDFTEETNSTRISLDEDKYILEPGVGYAWRVKAFTDANLTIFNNNGYSEIFMFSYGDNCPVPKETKSDVYGPDEVKISWETDPLQTSYVLRYRVTDQADAVWHTQESFLDNTMLSRLLEPLKTYEYQVMAKCNAGTSDYTGLLTFTTPYPMDKFTCGKPDSADIPSHNPKSTLRPGETIYNGKFPIKLTEVNGSNGTFTGKGQLLVPFLNQVKVNMKFNAIKVNEQNQVYEGDIASIYNPNSKYMVTVTLPSKKPVVEVTDTTNTVNNPSNGNINTVTKPTADSTQVAGNTVNPTGSSDSTAVAQNGTNPATNDSTATNGSALAAGGTGGSGTSNNNTSGNSTVPVDVRFHVQQDYLKIGYGQGIPVTFGIFHDLRDTTYTKVNFKVDNSAFDKSACLADLEDKDIKTGLPLPTYGDKFYHMAWIPKLEMETFPQVGKHELTFTLLKNNNQLAEKKLEIEVLPKYDLTGLTATDANNTKRVAKAGETLYLVKNPKSNSDRKVNYKVSLNNKDDIFWPGQPKWSTVLSKNTIDHATNSSSISFIHKEFPTITFGSNKNTTEVSAFDQSLSVNVELLKENIQNTNANPGDIALIPIKTTVLKKASEAIQKYLPFLRFKLTSKGTYTIYNKEDIKSRYYKRFRQLNHQTSLELTTKDPITIWGTSIKNVITIGVYLVPTVYGYHKISVDYEKLFFENDYTRLGLKNNFGAGLKLELGGRFAIAEGSKDIRCEARVYGSSGVKIEYELNNYTNEERVQLIFDPIVAGISAKITIPAIDWELINWSHEQQIYDRKIIILTDDSK